MATARIDYSTNLSRAISAAHVSTGAALLLCSPGPAQPYFSVAAKAKTFLSTFCAAEKDCQKQITSLDSRAAMEISLMGNNRELERYFQSAVSSHMAQH